MSLVKLLPALSIAPGVCLNSHINKLSSSAPGCSLGQHHDFTGGLKAVVGKEVYKDPLRNINLIMSLFLWEIFACVLSQTA